MRLDFVRLDSRPRGKSTTDILPKAIAVCAATWGCSCLVCTSPGCHMCCEFTVALADPGTTCGAKVIL